MMRFQLDLEDPLKDLKDSLKSQIWLEYPNALNINFQQNESAKTESAQNQWFRKTAAHWEFRNFGICQSSHVLVKGKKHT